MYRALATTLKSVFTLAVIPFLLSACSTSAIIGSWSEPGLTADDFNNVLVIGVARNDLVRRTYEDMMVARLKEKGIQASPSYRIIRQDAKADQDAVKRHMQQNNMDGVMVSKLIDERTESVITPAQTTVRTRDYYGRSNYNHWYTNYAASYDIVSTPATIQNYNVLTIETTLYKIQGDQEIPAWTAQSETVPSGNINSDLSELVDKLISDMKDQGVF